MPKQLNIRVPDELKRAIDRQRAAEGAETGVLKSRAEWMREAVREKLDADYQPENDEESPEKGAA